MSSGHHATWLYANASPADEQRRAFRNGEITVAVYGLGKMGLPLAAVFADVAGDVVGADIDPDVVRSINEGRSHVEREPGLPELVAETVEEGTLRAVDDPAAAASEAVVHVVIVPTGIHEDGTPDLSALEASAEAIATGIDPGDLVIVESTVPPGTCRDLVEPTIREHSDLDAGEFGVAFCPERTSSGRALRDIRGAYPKIVGGIDAESARAASLIYEELNEKGTIVVSDATTAETVKVFEGVYRDVNIALANELARFSGVLDVDVNEAIDAANTQPYCDIHRPGAGVGGHCIPYYPYFLIQPFDTDVPLLRTARRVNDSMPAFTVRRLQDELEAVGTDLDGATVLVLGLTYRADVAETTETPARPIVRWLDRLGAEVFAVDPLVDDFGSFEAVPVALDAMYDFDYDAAVLVTDHDEFHDIDWDAFENEMVVIDGRQALDLRDTKHRVYTIGSG